MLLYFSIICVSELLIVNYVGNAAGTMKNPRANVTEVMVGRVKSSTTIRTTTAMESVSFQTTTPTTMKSVLSVKKGPKRSTVFASGYSHKKTTSALNASPTTTTFMKPLNEGRTLGLLFPNLRNATGGAAAAGTGAGLFGANGLLTLLLTNLGSNDNIGVIVASLISAIAERRRTATSAANTSAMPVKNVSNNYFGAGAENPPYPYAYAGGYPYNYGGYDNYYAPYGYYYGK
ncbi:uncharacterized protein LOC129248288 [Anastrepha obliqua]|uniref:uncharacterized protein LOC129248288 n=1 Tax=Anastrepha obliqua TaxID=95512 RepID=UPI00240A0EB9|nr:uncharacterized protein LOC129248288 [Anastrepha obliqua]